MAKFSRALRRGPTREHPKRAKAREIARGPSSSSQAARATSPTRDQSFGRRLSQVIEPSHVVVGHAVGFAAGAAVPKAFALIQSFT